MKLTMWAARFFMAGWHVDLPSRPTRGMLRRAGHGPVDGWRCEANGAIAPSGLPKGSRNRNRPPGRVGIMISLNAEGIPQGQHGVHIHTTGTCEAPNFESAGGHWNPTNQQHGLDDPAGQHAGDMPNLEIEEDGRGTLEYTLRGGTFDGLLDEDGSAFIIHSTADDQVTDPSGNSGDRIACGVFQPD